MGDDVQQNLTTLTRSQSHMVALIAGGLSTQQIARTLFLSPHTVAKGICALMRKLDVQSQAELVATAYYTGILQVGTWPPEISVIDQFADPVEA